MFHTFKELMRTQIGLCMVVLTIMGEGSPLYLLTKKDCGRNGDHEIQLVLATHCLKEAQEAFANEIISELARDTKCECKL